MKSIGPTEVSNEIKKAKKIWLGTHRGPDGDGLSCQAALYHTLVAEGYKVDVVHFEALPLRYEYLFEGTLRITEKKKIQLHPEDLVLIFDTHDPRLCEPLTEICETTGTKMIFIDHHVPTSHSDFSQWAYVDPKAFCTGALVLKLIDTLDMKIRPFTATCLYTSLVFDTQNFRNVHSQSDPFIMAQRLIEALADTDLVQRKLIDHWSVDKLQFWSKLITKTDFLDQQKVALIRMSFEDIRTHQLTSDDVNDYIDLYLMVQTIEVAVLMREEEDGSFKLSFRSRAHEILSWAQKFEGGGHLFSAGVWVKSSSVEIEKQIKDLIAERDQKKVS